MSRARLEPRVEAVAEPVRPPVRLPTREEFAAECEAVTSAVVRTLETDVLTKTEKAAAAVSSLTVNEAERAKSKQIHYPPADLNFVPAYGLVTRHARKDAQVEGGITISIQLLEFLLRCVLQHIEFDEQQYQACNPDVALAVKQQRMESGRQHFIKTGYFEGRSGAVRVHEAWYLARNPDVAAAKRAGKLKSAAAQYRLGGANEWRVPSPQLEDAIWIWKNVLEK